MREALLKIIKHYGVNAQQRQLAEEVFELQEAILTRELHWHYDTEIQDIRPLDNHIAEEITDVMCLLFQFSEYYNIDANDISKTLAYKIKRQLERIKNEGKK